MSLKGIKILITAGPTYEPIDPVRFIGNRSSGKQGYAIAEALANSGADITLISGPTALTTELNIVAVETAKEMLAACENALPADIVICAAAVSDWAPIKYNDQKLKKQDGQNTFTLTLKKNPDILHTIATHTKRPRLVIGFAAETENLEVHAKEKLERKGCDWILANEVGPGENGEKVFGTDENHVYLITKGMTQDWPRASKRDIAQTLTQKIIEYFNAQQTSTRSPQ